MKRLIFVEPLLFSLILLFLPTQLGYHFWPSFSLVGGIRVDYLSPTVYFTDLIIVLLLALFFCRTVFVKRYTLYVTRKVFHRYAVVLFLILASEVVNSNNSYVGLQVLARFIECLFLGYYTYLFKNKIKLWAFAIPLVFESTLSVFQFLNQGSMNGIFYWFGERLFTGETPGIANASLNGHLVLRPYGTLPHPNVLAGFLLVYLLLFLSRASWKRQRNLILFVLILTSIGIALAMSRTIWILSAIGVLWFLLKKLSFRSVIVIVGLLIFVLFPIVSTRFQEVSSTSESITQRRDLIVASLHMIQDYPIFGVGPGNFLPSLPHYLSIKNQTLLQPVHNVFLLYLTETGIVGAIALLPFIVTMAKRLKLMILKNQMLAFGVLSVLIIGMVDHYFLTTHQGQLLLAVFLGMFL